MKYFSKGHTCQRCVKGSQYPCWLDTLVGRIRDASPGLQSWTFPCTYFNLGAISMPPGLLLLFSVLSLPCLFSRIPLTLSQLIKHPRQPKSNMNLSEFGLSKEFSHSVRRYCFHEVRAQMQNPQSTK